MDKVETEKVDIGLFLLSVLCVLCGLGGEVWLTLA